jgi:hypothetical protein
MPLDLSEAKFHCQFMPGRSISGAEPKLTSGAGSRCRSQRAASVDDDVLGSDRDFMKVRVGGSACVGGWASGACRLLVAAAVPEKRASVVVVDVSSVINAKPGFGDGT